MLFGNEGNYLTLGLIVGFISGDEHSVLKSLILLSKRSYEMLRMPVYKQLLFYSAPEKLKQKRIVIWRSILHIEQT